MSLDLLSMPTVIEPAAEECRVAGCCINVFSVQNKVFLKLISRLIHIFCICYLSMHVSVDLLNIPSIIELAAGECRIAGCCITSTGTIGDCSLSSGITKACSGNIECTVGSTITRTGWDSS
jgi:hypothetical protein